MIRAYDESYLTSAQRVLGDMMDYALVTIGVDIKIFEQIFLMSEEAKLFAAGNPAYIAGRNGCELARDILDASGYSYELQPDEIYIDKSPEFWCGWVLAYYQWYSRKSFNAILAAVGLSEILAMYSVYHEMDVAVFVDEMERRIAQKRVGTELSRHRKNNGLSQSELSARSGVPLRQIQLLEQRQRDINKAQAITLYNLSTALHCKMEDLMDL
jgi:hypothetical protein